MGAGRTGALAAPGDAATAAAAGAQRRVADDAGDDERADDRGDQDSLGPAARGRVREDGDRDHVGRGERAATAAP